MAECCKVLDSPLWMSPKQRIPSVFACWKDARPVLETFPSSSPFDSSSRPCHSDLARPSDATRSCHPDARLDTRLTRRCVGSIAGPVGIPLLSREGRATTRGTQPNHPSPSTTMVSHWALEGHVNPDVGKHTIVHLLAPVFSKSIPQRALPS